ncbi:glycosyltransferase family 4 protein [Bradyrhizobium sp. CCGUVB1N3]|uniref:glycosyltransferase family 4 protein n=1 Tax=Bradyrhizobium sp. CCGUVB1N3 TaxID=2949629 RepID=UPI0020B300A7|nr:glycosyltransferase family 4 protein [Bradyrhizobium sp. CCGUVB1N3]MCP3471632.1 glycosyltransferase family 4 protein [Bradyrhizobium sp. CCGUVB1N3]
MKVCFVGFDNLPILAREYNHHGNGGAQLQQTLLAKALVARGYQVSMVVWDYGQSDAAAWHGVTTYKAYRPDAGLPVLRFVYPRLTTTWAALMRADADVYYTSTEGGLVGLVAMFCRRHGRGFIHRLAHDNDADPKPKRLSILHTRDKQLYKYGLRHAHTILCQHAGQQRALMENYAVTSVVADPLLDPPSRQLDREKRDLEILWVSNLLPFKRPELAIELARHMPSRHIHMVGGPQPGFSDLYSKIESAAKRQPNLTFCGRVPYHDVGDLYDRAKVFVNTSDTEGFPNSFLQSWSRGVPVISFFDPGGLISREGLGVSLRSIDEMACAAEHLIADETEWRKVSMRCRNYMDRVHGDHVVLKPYVTAIEEAVRRRKK